MKINNGLLIFTLAFLMIPASYGDETEEDWTSWQGESEISVSIVGNSIINLDSDNRLIRAYVDIQNFDPSDGFFYMQIIQSTTAKIITEKEIVIREKSNGQAGADVAYMITDDVISTNGIPVQGDYLIKVFSERGSSMGDAPFSIIKPSEPQKLPEIEKQESEEENDKGADEFENTKDTESSAEYDENETEFENIKKIPDWVKNLFILYADESITDNELISALQFLIEQDIIQVTQ